MNKRHLLVAAGLLALMASGAQASTIVQNLSFGGSAPGSSVSGYPANVGFNLFDSTLGTLTSVSIDFSTTVRPRLRAFNDDSDVNETASLTALSGTTTVNATAFESTAAQVLTVTNTFYSVSGLPVSIAPGTTSSFTGTAQTLSDSAVVTAAGQLAFWQTAGGGSSATPIKVTVPTTTASGSCQGGDCFFNSVPNLYGTVTLTYNYTPNAPQVPEPVSMLLVGGSLLAVGVLGKRKVLNQD